MSTDILILKGSPRKNGNSNALADAFIEGVAETGRNYTVIRAADMKVSGCLGCEYCFRDDTKGICIQKDDMSEIIDKYRDAKILVFAMPVYYWTVPAQLKSIIDRTYALALVGMPKKEIILLMTCEDSSEGNTEPIIGMFRHYMAHYDWTERAIITARKVNQPGDIIGRPELEEARNLGKSL